MWRAAMLGALLAIAGSGCRAASEPPPEELMNHGEQGTGGSGFEEVDPEAAIQAATVLIADRCAGVIVDEGGDLPAEHAVTAAHCIQPGERQVELTFDDGSTDTADVAVVDRSQDLAILRLNNPAPVEGLRLTASLPEPGTQGFFAGRRDRGAVLQDVQVERLAPCPSLPGVPAALFTSLRGFPGDSGAPVVDASLQVIGLVHGGAACSIATPTAELPRMLETLSATAAVGGSGPPELAPNESVVR